jgi:hypothetical protein
LGAEEDPHTHNLVGKWLLGLHNQREEASNYRSFSHAAAGITCIYTYTALMLTDDAGWSILYA